MNEIDRLIAQKEAAIAQLRDEIKALKGARKIVEGVSGSSTAARRRGRVSKTAGTRAKGRAPRGAKKARVIGVMSAEPRRMRDIAEQAGVSTQEAASVLQAAVKRGEVKKGRQRGTYRLEKS